jgi:hypothetical protein
MTDMQPTVAGNTSFIKGIVSNFVTILSPGEVSVALGLDLLKNLVGITA